VFDNHEWDHLGKSLDEIADGCIKSAIFGGCLLVVVAFAAGFGLGLLFQ
jgi:hypothetical protein